MTILVIRGHPSGTLRSGCPFVCVLGSFGESAGIHFGHVFCNCSVILDAKMGDGFQIHVFDDSGMERLPECGGCMCYYP